MMMMMIYIRNQTTRFYTKLHHRVRFQFSRSGECGLPLHSHYCQANSDTDWKYQLRSHYGSNKSVWKLFVFDMHSWCYKSVCSWRGSYGNSYRRWIMYSATQVQILDKAICISYSPNSLGKGMHPNILPSIWVNSRASWLFNLGNQSKRRKILFSNQVTLLKNWRCITPCACWGVREYLYLNYLS